MITFVLFVKESERNAVELRMIEVMFEVLKQPRLDEFLAEDRVDEILSSESVESSCFIDVRKLLPVLLRRLLESLVEFRRAETFVENRLGKAVDDLSGLEGVEGINVLDDVPLERDEHILESVRLEVVE